MSDITEPSLAAREDGMKNKIKHWEELAKLLANIEESRASMEKQRRQTSFKWMLPRRIMMMRCNMQANEELFRQAMKSTDSSEDDCDVAL